MKTTAKSTMLRFITFLMIGMLAMLVANKAVFLHVHQLNDGTYVAHAHPYDKSADSEPVKTHHHSNAEFIFFKNFELFFPVLFIAFAFGLLVKTEHRSIEQTISYQTIYISQNKGRAPPVL